jgi:hypothetical protein
MSTAPSEPAEQQHEGRAPFSTQVDRQLLRRVRAAVRGVSHATGTNYTLAALTEDALTAEVDRLETLYNDGQEWPERPLRRGRRTS